VKGDSEQPLVKHLEIVRVIPCLADPDKIRFTAEFDRDISGVFPYLNAALDGAIYHHAGKTLTLRRNGRLITLHPRQAVAAKVDDLEDAHRILEWLIKLINECHRKRSTLKPNYERRAQLTVIDIVKLLPGTNCKKCGHATCLAFAALISAQRASIMACADIFLTPFRAKREELVNLLKASGYLLPDVII